MEIELKVKLIELSWENLSEMKFPLCSFFFSVEVYQLFFTPVSCYAASICIMTNRSLSRHSFRMTRDQDSRYEANKVLSQRDKKSHNAKRYSQVCITQRIVSSFLDILKASEIFDISHF